MLKDLEIVQSVGNSVLQHISVERRLGDARCVQAGWCYLPCRTQLRLLQGLWELAGVLLGTPVWLLVGKRTFSVCSAMVSMSHGVISVIGSGSRFGAGVISRQIRFGGSSSLGEESCCCPPLTWDGSSVLSRGGKSTVAVGEACFGVEADRSNA